MMTKRSKVSVITTLVALACFAGSVWFQHGHIKESRIFIYNFRDSLYLPQSEYVQAVTLGYDAFAADFLWLRMIQTFAAGWSRPENADQMKHYFDVITDLDPNFVAAYSFAIMAVGEEAERHDLVRSIVDKAIIKNPRDYTIPYEGAFYAFWNMNDIDLAKYYARMARNDPKAPEFLNRWEGYFDLKGGRYMAAYEKFMGDLIAGIVDNHPRHSIDIQYSQLRRAVNEWIIAEITEQAERYMEQHGGEVPSIEQLAASDLVREIEAPDWPMIASVIEGFESGAMERPTAEAIRDFARRAVHRWDRIPPGPFDKELEGEEGYVIWENWVADATEPFDVMSRVRALKRLQEINLYLQSRVQQYQEKNDGQCPPDIWTAAPNDRNIIDPIGEGFYLEEETCQVRHSSYIRLALMEIPSL